MSKNTKLLTEDEVKELCESLEEKREELNTQIKAKMETLVNIAYYPSRAALKDALIADEHTLNELTCDFIDEFLEVICDVFSKRMPPTDKKASLSHAWSK